MTEDRFRKAFLLILVVATSVSFLALIRSFLTTILMAAIFTGLAYPIYARLHRALRGSRPLAWAYPTDTLSPRVVRVTW